MHIEVLALDLESTLINDALRADPRPGLSEFLTFCSAGIVGTDPGPASKPQIATVHVLFNIASVLLFLPFLPYMAKLMTWLILDKPGQMNLKTTLMPNGDQTFRNTHSPPRYEVF